MTGSWRRMRKARNHAMHGIEMRQELLNLIERLFVFIK